MYMTVQITYFTQFAFFGEVVYSIYVVNWYIVGILLVYYWVYQDGSVGDPSLYPSTKINNYIAIQDEKQFQECSGVHLINFSNTVKQTNKKLRKTSQKGREE